MLLALSAIALLSIILSVFAYDLQPTEECPILGPIWPASTYDIAQSEAFASAKDAFPETIQALFDAGVIDPQTSTFALDVYSTRTNESIYSYFHLAKAEGAEQTLSAGVLDDQTVFRTGSVSKLYTVYAILAAGDKGLDIFNEKVVKYVPELLLVSGEDESARDDLARIKWDEITIGALASHQGGVGGAPSPEIIGCGCEDLTSCDISKTEECTQVFLDYMRDAKHPTQPIYQTPTYADGGFITLTQVLRRMTNLTYDEAIKKYLGEPLGLNVSSSIAGEAQEANAVILPGGISQGSNWGIDNQVIAGSGGIYSNLRDFRILGLSILQNEFLAPQTTKQWMKPLGHVGSPYKAVGAPWEIERLAIPVGPDSNRTRISDLYTKAGGQPGYTAVLALSPDHGIGYSVLVAGPGAGSDRWPLRARLGEAVVTAAEHAGREHAQASTAGTFVSEEHEGTNLTLTIRPDHPGVTLESIFIGGVDWRTNLTSIYQAALPEAVLANMSIPMFPTGLASKTGDGECQRLQYRATPNTLPNVYPTTRAAAEGGIGLFDDVCSSPFGTTAFFNLANGAAIDGFVFVFDGEGRLASVEYPAADVKFVKGWDSVGAAVASLFGRLADD